MEKERLVRILPDKLDRLLRHTVFQVIACFSFARPYRPGSEESFREGTGCRGVGDVNIEALVQGIVGFGTQVPFPDMCSRVSCLFE